MTDTLENYRNEINKIDKLLVDIIKQRMKLSLKIGKYKKDNNMEILNSNREKEVVNKINEYNKKETEIILEDEFIKDLWTTLMNYSKITNLIILT